MVDGPRRTYRSAAAVAHAGGGGEPVAVAPLRHALLRGCHHPRIRAWRPAQKFGSYEPLGKWKAGNAES
jgi:hypothetical protein